MCIIIDSCVLSCVFSSNDLNHKEYIPVLNWILNKRGFVIFGGTKYIKELKSASKYMNIINLLKDTNKAFLLDRERVDNYQKIVSRKETNSDFDDPHIVAMVIESGCRILCTHDNRSKKFLLNKKLYLEKTKPPFFYQKESDKKYLIDKNIPKKWKSSCKLINKNIKKKIIQSIPN